MADALIHALAPRRLPVACSSMHSAATLHSAAKSADGYAMAACMSCSASRRFVPTLPFVRFDLRLHRKIMAIDGGIGYTGSIEPRRPAIFRKTQDSASRG